MAAHSVFIIKYAVSSYRLCFTFFFSFVSLGDLSFVVGYLDLASNCLLSFQTFVDSIIVPSLFNS